MRLQAVLAVTAMVLLAACGDAAGRGVAAASAAGGASQAASRTASATPTFNMDDMMGFYPQQTVFVADVNAVSAVTLLNHFTRYSIATRGKAQVAVAPRPIAWLYVLDGEFGTGSLRLRTFDLQTGTERASRSDIDAVASPVRALASIGDGRVFVLKSDARHAWIDAYEQLSLRPLGMVAEKPGCGDRLLASDARVAIVCRATGEIAVNSLRGGATAAVDAPIAGLVGAAMTQGGAIFTVTADRKLSTVASDSVNVRPLAWPTVWTGTVLPDGIALATGPDSVIFAQQDTDGPWLRVLALSVFAPRASLHLSSRISDTPQTGILALYPFAYFTSGGSVRHVEIESGMLETMTELGPSATIAAVVER